MVPEQLDPEQIFVDANIYHAAGIVHAPVSISRAQLHRGLVFIVNTTSTVRTDYKRSEYLNLVIICLNDVVRFILSLVILKEIFS